MLAWMNIVLRPHSCARFRVIAAVLICGFLQDIYLWRHLCWRVPGKEEFRAAFDEFGVLGVQCRPRSLCREDRQRRAYACECFGAAPSGRARKMAPGRRVAHERGLENKHTFRYPRSAVVKVLVLARRPRWEQFSLWYGPPHRHGSIVNVADSLAVPPPQGDRQIRLHTALLPGLEVICTVLCSLRLATTCKTDVPVVRAFVESKLWITSVVPARVLGRVAGLFPNRLRGNRVKFPHAERKRVH